MRKFIYLFFFSTMLAAASCSSSKSAGKNYGAQLEQNTSVYATEYKVGNGRYISFGPPSFIQSDELSVLPEFPGGDLGLCNWLKDNIFYPSISYENGGQGTVLLGFTLNKDGSVSDVSILKSSNDFYIDKEAKRIFSALPKWKPAQKKRKNVPTNVRFPVRFSIKQ